VVRRDWKGAHHAHAYKRNFSALPLLTANSNARSSRCILPGTCAFRAPVGIYPRVPRCLLRLACADADHAYAYFAYVGTGLRGGRHGGISWRVLPRDSTPPSPPAFLLWDGRDISLRQNYIQNVHRISYNVDHNRTRACANANVRGLALSSLLTSVTVAHITAACYSGSGRRGQAWRTSCAISGIKNLCMETQQQKKKKKKKNALRTHTPLSRKKKHTTPHSTHTAICMATSNILATCHSAAATTPALFWAGAGQRATDLSLPVAPHERTRSALFPA